MVPVADLQHLLLTDVERTLAAYLVEACELDRLFATYVLRGVAVLPGVAEVVHRAREQIRGAARSYQHVALLGFSSMLDDTLRGSDAALDAGARWLANTNAFIDGVPTGVVDDPVALLGLALATRSVGQPFDGDLRAWLSTLMDAQARLEHEYESELYGAARRLVGMEAASALGASAKAIEGAVAMARLGLRWPVDPRDVVVALKAILSGDVAHEPRRATLQLALLHHARDLSQQVAIRAADVHDVVRLLERVSNSLREWTWEVKARTKGGQARHWHIDSEYHVQNLLWALLAPVFPDICREEYVPAAGALQPRLDMGMPSLRTLLEVKFWRANDPEKKLLEEIASDASLYFGAPARRYDHMIVFVWDEARRTEAHALLRRGLAGLPNVAGVVIVPRPAKMISAPAEVDDS